MSHTRQQVREAFVSLLNSGTHAKWTRAYESRIPTARQPAWNYLMVFCPSDISVKETIHPTSIYSRDTTVNVIGMLRLPGNGDTQTIEDKMDAMAVDIETRLTYAALNAILPKVQNLSLDSSSFDVIVDEEGSPQHAELTMVWRVGYSHDEGAPETFI
jgi:hypothetical protein